MSCFAKKSLAQQTYFAIRTADLYVLALTTLFLTFYSEAANEAEHKHLAAAVWHGSFTPHSLANETQFFFSFC